ncbi:MAG: hypothetical protein JMN25_16190 [gamma proteobacterium endosymbiont of Lamellibrachia anaximandri]|nr:hypothetical protein [gamma proteobacterium endosymbiont of Lamellibrachia anaximandri]
MSAAPIRKEEPSSSGPGLRLPGLDLSSARQRAISVLLLLVVFIFVSWLALTQKPYHDVFHEPSGIDFLLYPIERNAFKRLPVIAQSLNDLYVLPDGAHLWVVGSEGLILHSHDGGNCWAPQTFPGGPEIPEEQIDRCDLQWQPELPSLISTANAAVEKRPPLAKKVPPKKVPEPTEPDVSQEQRVQEVQPTGKVEPVEPSSVQSVIEPVVEVEKNIPDLFSVHFVDAANGWLVGERGLILVTRNGGKNWAVQVSGVEGSLAEVQFSDEKHGWVLEGKGLVSGRDLLSTRDGGTTWGRTVSDINAFFFLDEKRGWAVTGSGQLLATSNGGEEWRNMEVEGRLSPAQAIQFIDAERGWMMGYEGSIRTTGDGGKSWMTLKREVRVRLTSFHFIDALNGWVIGADGLLFSTEDGGAGWKQNRLGVPISDFVKVAFLDRRQGWVVGNSGEILATRDGGENWFPQASGDAALSLDQSSDRPPAQYRRYLAPWYGLAVSLLAFLTFLAVRPLPVKTRSTTVADMLAADRPLQPGDKNRDVLDLNRVADDLFTFLNNRNTDAPFTLAVTGEWGSGKSSLMELLRGRLRMAGFRPVWFNAWHHQQGEQLLASLFAHIREQAIPGWLQRGGLQFRLRLAARRGLRHWFFYAIVLVVFCATVAYYRQHLLDIANGLAHLLRHPESWWMAYGDWLGDLIAQPIKSMIETKTETWVALFGLGAPLLAVLRSVKGFAINPSRLLTINPDKRGQKGLDPGARGRFANEFRDVTQCLPRKMVIFIDDLDRCSKENLIDILENVNFLATSGECFLVLGMSQRWVISCVALKYKELAEEMAQETSGDGNDLEMRREFARNYLEKMINIEVPMPEMEESAASALMHSAEPAVQAVPYRGWREYLRLIVANAMSLAPQLRHLAPQLRRLVPYAVLALAVGYGSWFGMSIPDKTPPVMKSWPLGAVTLDEIKTGKTTLRLIDEKARLKPGFKLELEGQPKVLEQGVELASYGVEGAKVSLLFKKLQAEDKSGTGQTGGPSESQPELEDPQGRRLRGDSDGPAFSAPDRLSERSTPWLIWLLALLGIGALIYAGRLEESETREDSPEFTKALKIWLPWIMGRQTTPRSVKRYLNLVRFFGIRLRRQVKEPTMVALSAIHYFNERWLSDADEFAKVLDGKFEGLFDELMEGESLSPQAEVLKQEMTKAVEEFQAWVDELGEQSPDNPRGIWPPSESDRKAVMAILPKRETE